MISLITSYSCVRRLIHESVAPEFQAVCKENVYIPAFRSNELSMFSDECARHAQGPGIVWIQYKPNCHKYVMCEPVGWGKYRKHVMPCGDLFWDQNAKTCTRTKTGNCVVGSPVGYTGPPPVQGKSACVPYYCSVKILSPPRPSM